MNNIYKQKNKNIPKILICILVNQKNLNLKSFTFVSAFKLEFDYKKRIALCLALFSFQIE